MGYREGDSTYTFEGKIEHATIKAYLVIPTMGPNQIWVPKSQCKSVSDPDADGNCEFVVAEWWAKNSDMKEFV
jgi:hypothetical protein